MIDLPLNSILTMLETLPNWVFIGVALLAALPLTLKARKKALSRKKAAKKNKIRRNKNHAWRRAVAKKVLRQVSKGGATPGDVFGRIRSMDPLAFEEMVLSAISREGHKIVRSESYSGDGGVDGEAFINGERYILQMKRYRNHINPKHVDAFNKACKLNKCPGLFVHSGKTGVMSWRRASDGNISIISGDRLYRLLTARGVDFPPFNGQSLSCSGVGAM